jgi:3-oxoacyl-[acyl-carrier-protein] synthase-1
LIRAGVIERAILIGIDIISKTTLIGFDSLQLVSEKASCPLTEQRDGLTLGEGAGILVLENKPRTSSDFEVAGVGSGVDGYHITSPDPSGKNQRKCINDALNEAGIQAEDVGYVNAHGTGTKMNDQVELAVLEDIFNEKTCVTSLKSYIGHTLGASTITEISICIDMLKNGFIYQPADFSNPISSLIPSKTIEAKNIKYFLKNSFGFGGNNISVLIKTNMSDDSGEKEE